MRITSKKPNVPFFVSFSRYTVSATSATATDFTTLLIGKEIFGLDPVTATFIGACLGAAVAFILGRNWTFFNKEGKVSKQGFRFLLVVGGSILLNTFGEYVFTEIWVLPHYMIARVITAISVGVMYNFPMQRYFVFNDK